MQIISKQRNSFYDNITKTLLNAKEKEWQNAGDLQVNFPAFIILDATKHMPELSTWRKEACRFLTKQLHPTSKTINWWQRESLSYRHEPYPDDLDDTFCSWAAIANTYPEIITPNILASLIKTLTLCEQQPGGPYATWVVPKTADQWRDADLAVNCNIAYFLATQNIVLPKQIQFIRNQLHMSYHSKYYPSAYPLLYFFGRLYETLPRAQQLVFAFERLRILSFLTEQQTCVKTQLNAALVISTMVRLRCATTHTNTLQAHMNTMMQQKQSKSEPFCIHTHKHGVMKTAGSPLVTMALCAEAQQLYEAWKTKPAYQQSNAAIYSHQILKKMLNIFHTESHGVLKHHLLLFLRKNQRDPALEMTIQLHLLTARALDISISQDILEQISLAQFFGWIAYTLFDSIQDSKVSKDSHLFCGVYCKRKAIQFFSPFLQNSRWFDARFHTIMEKMDCAQMKRRSLAYHALGCEMGVVALLSTLPKNIRDTFAEPLQTFFLQFLTAKQLSDDAKDIEYDTKHHLETSMTYHSNDRVAYLCKRLSFHLNACRKIIVGLPLKYPEHLLQLLIPLEKRLQSINKDLQNTKDFLSSYKRNDMLEHEDGISTRSIPASRVNGTGDAPSRTGAAPA